MSPKGEERKNMEVINDRKKKEVSTGSSRMEFSV